MAQQQTHRNVRRKLRRASKAAMHGVERALEIVHRRGDDVSRRWTGTAVNIGGSRRPGRHLRGGFSRGIRRRPRPATFHVVTNGLHQRARGLANAIGIAVKCIGQIAEQAQETVPRAACTVAGRKIRPAEERLAFRGEPHAHGPSAAPRQLLDRAHVDGVDVGTLFSIDLDRDVVHVQKGRDLLVLERFGLHDVAPVAGGISDRQKHRPPQTPRLRERLVAPRIPVDGIVRVLEQVGTRLERQPVREPWPTVAVEMMRARSRLATTGRDNRPPAFRPDQRTQARLQATRPLSSTPHTPLTSPRAHGCHLISPCSWPCLRPCPRCRARFAQDRAAIVRSWGWTHVPDRRCGRRPRWQSARRSAAVGP